jgi:starch phosphorylase
MENFPRHAAIQMNDTHPSLAVAELMRLFVDEFDCLGTIMGHDLGISVLHQPYLLRRPWKSGLYRSWSVSSPATFRSSTKSTAASWRGRPAMARDDERQRRMSLIEEGEDKKVRMAHLAVAGSHAVNGVSVLHSELVRKELVPDFFSLWPDRFLNVTNGVTQRRWLLQANPDLADLISQAVGPKWIVSLDALAVSGRLCEDRPFQDALARVKRNNKERLCRFVAKATGLSPDPESLFDVQVKRIHEYKRQLLKLLHIIHEYVMFAEEGRAPAVARTFLFAGKAAPGYWQARQIIKLIHSVAETLRRDSRVNPWLKVVFLPDYRVSLAEVLIPAADLS